VEGERQHYNLTLGILTLAGLAYALQQTMVIPALPALQRDLHTTTTWVTWVLTVFLLVASVATPLLGKLGDQYGKERLLVISLAVFLAGIGLVSAVFGIGGGFGIVLSGLIVDHASWRWIFVVGAIIIAVATVLVRRFVPESPIKTASRRASVGRAGGAAPRADRG
jgi:MFS family permease